jgi:type I pantothenate kinase
MPLPGRIPRDGPEQRVAAGFEVFTRERWAALGRRSESTLSMSDTERLVARGEPVSLDEVSEVYRPLSQLLALLADAGRERRQRMDEFLREDIAPSPFVIGIAGSVAVGKSTTARLLQALLRRSDGNPSVELLTTDGFLLPNAELEDRGLMARKGFPESYDQRRLMEVLAAIRAGDREVVTPVYSHFLYDIVPDEFHVLRRPSIVIVEGLNVLQVSTKGVSSDHGVASDFFDFSIYVDAAEEDIARWFGERLLALRATVLHEPQAYFHRFAALPPEEVANLGHQIWSEINLVNLRQNVAPTRGRAHLVLQKDADHRVDRILLRRS